MFPLGQWLDVRLIPLLASLLVPLYHLLLFRSYNVETAGMGLLRQVLSVCDAVCPLGLVIVAVAEFSSQKTRSVIVAVKPLLNASVAEGTIDQSTATVSNVRNRTCLLLASSDWSVGTFDQ